MQQVENVVNVKKMHLNEEAEYKRGVARSENGR